MENTKKKSQDLFEDLLLNELSEGDASQDNLTGTLVDLRTSARDQNVYIVSDDDDSAPPPPMGKKSKPDLKSKAMANSKTSDNSSNDSMEPPGLKPKSLKKVTNEDSFENQFVGVEVSEIFPSDAAMVRQHMDSTQKLPMADPFEIPLEEPSPKVLPKNVVDLQNHLKSSNYLEVAQNRVLELEKEVQKLRRDSEQLAAAGKHFKELTVSLKMQVKQSEANYQNMQEIAKEEKKILMQSLEAKEIKISALQERVVDVEQRQGSQFENVRIRERELENRLEIMKSETEALAHAKDEMIMELKKQVQSVQHDLEKYRIQNQKISSKMENKEELLRRTVKALRIALTMLEGNNLEEE